MHYFLLKQEAIFQGYYLVRIANSIMIVMNGKLDMFNVDETVNLLHKDGTAHYYGTIMPYKEADRYFDLLLKKVLFLSYIKGFLF